MRRRPCSLPPPTLAGVWWWRSEVALPSGHGHIAGPRGGAAAQLGEAGDQACVPQVCVAIDWVVTASGSQWPCVQEIGAAMSPVFDVNQELLFTTIVIPEHSEWPQPI